MTDPYEAIGTGAFAILLLVTLHWTLWRIVKRSLALEYEPAEPSPIPRSFPNQRPYRLARLTFGLLFVLAMVWGALSNEQGLPAFYTSLGPLIAFCVVSSVESWKAFRYFAEHNLIARARGGYVDR